MTIRGNVIEAPVAIDMKRKDSRFEVRNLEFDGNVLYQTADGLPLKHDGYVVERMGNGEWGMGNREKATLVVKAGTRRAFLYANYESNRWMNAASYPFVRRFPGPLLIRTRCPDTSPNSTL